MKTRHTHKTYLDVSQKETYLNVNDLFPRSKIVAVTSTWFLSTNSIYQTKLLFFFYEVLNLTEDSYQGFRKLFSVFWLWTQLQQKMNQNFHSRSPQVGVLFFVFGRSKAFLHQAYDNFLFWFVESLKSRTNFIFQAPSTLVIRNSLQGEVLRGFLVLQSKNSKWNLVFRLPFEIKIDVAIGFFIGPMEKFSK